MITMSKCNTLNTCPRCGSRCGYPRIGATVICRGTATKPHPSWEYLVGDDGFETIGPFPPLTCKQCQSELAPVAIDFFTEVAPTVTLRCQHCDLLAFVFAVEGKDDLVVWSDDVHGAGEPFGDYVRDMLERRRLH